MHNFHRAGTALGLIALALVGACGTEPAKPATVEPTSSVTQNAVVGTKVASQPAVKVTDSHGNVMSGQDVTFAVTSGGGLVDSSTVKTDDQGIAKTAWTMGTTSGNNTVTATVASLPVVTFTAIAAAGAPNAITVTAGDNQSATVGTTLPTNAAVKVLDKYSNPVPGAAVTFSVQSGNGTITGGDATTDAAGVATVGSWTLGLTAGANKLGATAPGVVSSAGINATGLADVPSKLVIGTQPSGAVTGIAFTTQPVVRITDANGNTATTSSASITATVASGSGTLGGTATVAAVNGVATFANLFINGSGDHALAFASNGLTGVNSTTFTVFTTNVGSVSSVGGDLQAAMAGTVVASRPSVRVLNLSGAPAAGAVVTFAVASGGGSITGATATTDSQGIATVGSWTLGAAGGFNTLTATVGNATGAPGNPVTFSASGCFGGGGTGYQMTLCFTSAMTTNQRAAFTNAAAKWASVITGDLADDNTGSVEFPVGVCGSAQYTLPANFAVDDLIIFAQVKPIDGVNGILGQAGPCIYRGDAADTPILGIMQFDAADVANMESNNTLNSVILHEMGHVLGIGSNWNDSFATPPRTLVQNLTTATAKNDTYYNGTNGLAGFDAIGGTTYVGNKVPVENTNGPGTWNVHWRENVFNSELMTGFVSSSTNPMSLLTVKSLIDLGYTVDETKADAYTLGAIKATPNLAAPLADLRNDVIVFPRTTFQAVARRARRKP